MAGFEPTTSSSQIGPWEAADHELKPKLQVRASGRVGLRWLDAAAAARLSPGFLHGLGGYDFSRRLGTAMCSCWSPYIAAWNAAPISRARFSVSIGHMEM